jgi:hypothetical protein
MRSQITSDYLGDPSHEGQLKPDQSDWSMAIFRRKLLRNKEKVVRIKTCWAWWCMSEIPVTGRLKQEDHELRLAWATQRVLCQPKLSDPVSNSTTKQSHFCQPFQSKAKVKRLKTMGSYVWVFWIDNQKFYS